MFCVASGPLREPLGCRAPVPEGSGLPDQQVHLHGPVPFRRPSPCPHLLSPVLAHSLLRGSSEERKWRVQKNRHAPGERACMALGPERLVWFQQTSRTFRILPLHANLVTANTLGRGKWADSWHLEGLLLHKNPSCSSICDNRFGRHSLKNTLPNGPCPQQPGAR